MKHRKQFFFDIYYFYDFGLEPLKILNIIMLKLSLLCCYFKLPRLFGTFWFIIYWICIICQCLKKINTTDHFRAHDYAGCESSLRSFSVSCLPFIMLYNIIRSYFDLVIVWTHVDTNLNTLSWMHMRVKFSKS